MHRDRQPLPPPGGFDPIPILPIIFLVLNIVQKTKHVRPAHFIKIAKPGEILGLMDCNNQICSSLKYQLLFRVTKIGFDSRYPPDLLFTSSR